MSTELELREAMDEVTFDSHPILARMELLRTMILVMMMCACIRMRAGGQALFPNEHKVSMHRARHAVKSVG